MAVIIPAAVTWAGPRNDVVTVLSITITSDYLAAPTNDMDVILYRQVEHEEPVGSVVGIEIVDFLDFDRWNDLPVLDLLWQLPKQEPLPLTIALQRVQHQLRQEQRKSA